VRIALGEVRQADEVEDLGDARPPLAAARALEPEADVLRYGEVGKSA